MSIHSLNTRNGLPPRRTHRGLRANLLVAGGILFGVGTACSLIPTSSESSATPISVVGSPTPTPDASPALRPALILPSPFPSPSASPSPEITTSTDVVRVSAGRLDGINFKKLTTDPEIQALRDILARKGIPLNLHYYFDPKVGETEPALIEETVSAKNTDRVGVKFYRLPSLDPAHLDNNIFGLSPGDPLHYRYIFRVGDPNIPNSRTVDLAFTGIVVRRKDNLGFAAVAEKRTDGQGRIIYDRIYTESPVNPNYRKAIVYDW